MAARRLNERLGLLAVALLVGGPSAAVLAGRASVPRDVTVLRASMPEAGGWQPGGLSARVGDTIHLRLTSDDVVHGFAVGQSDRLPLDVHPGRVTEVALSFDRIGTYTFFCTRWCGPNHWRMRGTIEVTGSGEPTTHAERAPYLALGIDLDAPHPPDVRPAAMPVAARGAVPARDVPAALLAADYIRRHSPAAVWRTLRASSSTQRLSDEDLWSVVAWAWRRSTTTSALESGRQLYGRDCAACHGPLGRGDGVMRASFVAAPAVASAPGADTAAHGRGGHEVALPVDFTAPDLLGASPALLHGKIVRGGMGTGMPAWGAIYTDAEVWAIVSFLYGFQFSYSDLGGLP